MVQVELLLASVLGIDADLIESSFVDSSERELVLISLNSDSYDSTPPPHFYGELVKTAEGCDILTLSGHFADFATFIRQHGLEDSDSIIIGKLKSVLWAVVSVLDYMIHSRLMNYCRDKWELLLVDYPF